MMRIEDDSRKPIYGRTVTAGFDGLLDRGIDLQKRIKEGIKALNKFAFIHPEYRAEVSFIINKLEA